MKKTILFVVLMIVFLRPLGAQKPVSFYPFKGFHVGLTGQTEFVEKPAFYLVNDGDPIPTGRWTSGWETGIEFSYHFAKYFGVSVGINYGTALSYDCAIYWRTVPGYNDEWGTYYETLYLTLQDWETIFPIKFEFHYPLGKNLFFTAEAGVKLKGIINRLGYGKDATGSYRASMSPLVPNPDRPYGPYDRIEYFSYWGEREISKIHCNLLIGIGLYYKLPYGDLLRFNAGVNLSFGNIVEGNYQYHISGSSGVFAVKNDFIYTQLSYIHTLNWQKAKKYVQKQEYSFSSKKERRGKILEVLKDW